MATKKAKQTVVAIGEPKKSAGIGLLKVGTHQRNHGVRQVLPSQLALKPTEFKRLICQKNKLNKW
jgi:hypothetical protein